MFQNAVEFLKLEKVEYAGIKGRMLSAQTVEIYEEFNEMYKTFQDVTYDPLDPQDTVEMHIPFYLLLLLLLQPFYGSLDFVRSNPGEPVPEENLHPLTPIVVINYPLSASSIYYDTCLIYVPGSLFAQSLSKFSLVYLLAWHPRLHTPYISLPNHCLLFAAHAHTVAACFVVVPRLCHLILVSLTTLYLELYLVA